MHLRTGLTTASLLLVLTLTAGCGGTRTVVTTVTRTVPPAPSATGDQRLYGRIVSLTLRDGHYELRFDPALLVSGVTANVVQAEDMGTVCRPSACPPVANDNQTVDEGHRALVFLLPTTVRGTVLLKGGTNGFLGHPVTVAQLAQLVAGTSSLQLYEPLSTGVWLLVHSDTVRTFAQQYKP